LFGIIVGFLAMVL